jgi:hypothetical protein
MNQTKITLSLHAVPRLDVARDASLGVGLFELLLVLAASGFGFTVFPALYEYESLEDTLPDESN